MRILRSLGIASIGLLVGILAGCGGGRVTGSEEPAAHVERVVLVPPKPVDRSALRWRDVAEGLYSRAFRRSFSYADPSVSSVAVQWPGQAPLFRGTLTATRVKPNFAYQIKLVGRTNITTADAPAPTAGPQEWASWQLGHAGRWWCVTDGWNVSDADLASHLAQGHYVIGYLLLDFFITDLEGAAVKSFRLNSTYHVLWRTDQRVPQPNDSRLKSCDLIRGAWGYDFSHPRRGGHVEVYAEWEPDRPLPGQVRLPDGRYPVLFNITEESFHDNLGNSVPHGGFWAQVLEGPMNFRIVSDVAG
jgi:hypothetical protein